MSESRTTNSIITAPCQDEAIKKLLYFNQLITLMLSGRTFGFQKVAGERQTLAAFGAMAKPSVGAFGTGIIFTDRRAQVFFPNGIADTNDHVHLSRLI
jgi:hypothetical protein